MLLCAAPPNVGKLHELVVNNSMILTKLILELESSTVYRIEVAAETVSGGRGVGVSVDGETLVAARTYTKYKRCIINHCWTELFFSLYSATLSTGSVILSLQTTTNHPYSAS